MNINVKLINSLQQYKNLVKYDDPKLQYMNNPNYNDNNLPNNLNDPTFT